MSASPASWVAQIECVQGVPVVIVARRPDTNMASVFDSQTGRLHDQPRARLLHYQSIRSTALCGRRTGAFCVPEPTKERVEIPGFRPLLDIDPDREIAHNGSAA